VVDKDEMLLLLNEKWGCSLEFGWVPITGESRLPDFEIFDSNYFQDIIESVRSLVRNTLELRSLFELREDGRFERISIDECQLGYDGLEYIYTNESLDVVLYFSHETSTTVAGQKLIDGIHELWPQYKDHYWLPHWRQ
jgi:hypothetical protein